MRKKKYGLALGSGGAKGVVHIGCLQAFQEEKISFDITCGSSIGSVIAGMYALGYSAREMSLFLKEMDLLNSKWILNAKFKGVYLNNILESVLGERDFSELKKPYKAIATDLNSGEEVVVSSGDLCLAMAASCAIPPAFNPIKIGDRLLIDGAFVNSIPADECKKMGADYVLGIDLSADRPMNYTSVNFLNKFYKGHGVKRCSRSYNGYRYADLILAPDLSKYTIMGTKNSEKLFEIGYELVKSNLKTIKEKLHIIS